MKKKRTIFAALMLVLLFVVGVNMLYAGDDDPQMGDQNELTKYYQTMRYCPDQTVPVLACTKRNLANLCQRYYCLTDN